MHDRTFPATPKRLRPDERGYDKIDSQQADHDPGPLSKPNPHSLPGAVFHYFSDRRSGAARHHDRKAVADREKQNEEDARGNFLLNCDYSQNRGNEPESAGARQHTVAEAKPKRAPNPVEI